jgi:hypothetical protein
VLPRADAQTAQLSLTLGQAHIAGIVGSVTVNETTNVGKLSVLDRCTEVCQTKISDSIKFNPLT